MAEDHKVGYGKPPQSHQFKKGKSGNAKGRPKGSKNLRTALSDELHSRITIREGSRKRSLTKQEVLVKRIVADALKGQHKSQVLLLHATMQYERNGDLVPSNAPVSDSERAILDRYARNRIKRGDIKLEE